MLRSIYLGLGSFCLAGYLGWSVMGMEWGGGRDPIPHVPSASSSSSYGGRSGGGFFGGGGGGFGK